MIKNIVFDFGGVIVDIDRDKAVQAFIKLGLADADTRLDKLNYILELRKSYHVYILSNTNPFVMSWACSPDFSSKKKPLNDYCDKLYLSYQVGHTKPAPEIFDYMVNDCNIIPSETLFVDDGASNIQIGKELGFETFQPKNGADWREEMTAILEKR